MRAQKNGKAKEVVAVLATPGLFDQTHGHHDEDCAANGDMDQDKVAGRRMEFGTRIALDPVVQVDLSRQTALFVVTVAIAIKGNVKGNLGGIPGDEKEQTEDDKLLAQVRHTVLLDLGKYATGHFGLVVARSCGMGVWQGGRRDVHSAVWKGDVGG
jgi:hypothetical protein